MRVTAICFLGYKLAWGLWSCFLNQNSGPRAGSGKGALLKNLGPRRPRCVCQVCGEAATVCLPGVRLQVAGRPREGRLRSPSGARGAICPGRQAPSELRLFLAVCTGSVD